MKLDRYRFAVTRLRHMRDAVAETGGYDWRAVHYNRISAINRALAFVGPSSRYLEIGCAMNDCFDAVIADHKVGVDPGLGGTHRMTSDAFFARNTETFDVIFVDGLHTFDQVRRDARNALACLRVGGFVFFHDMLPNNWKEAHVPRVGIAWSGDVWKLGFELRGAEGVSHDIIRIDHGVGVVRKDRDDASIPDRFAELADKDYRYFLRSRAELSVISFEEFVTKYGV